MKSLPIRPVAAAVALAFAATSGAADNVVETAAVHVVGTTPLAGVGVPREQVPANVQSVGGERIAESGALHLGEFMARQLPSVNINETQGNPLQPDVNYRGFSASPLLGTPQGLSVYVDGVRVNEAFGDTVNWDLLPRSAIAGIDLIPGSNPAFGLNTLGGALAVRTKSGDTHPGTRVEAGGGSFGRRKAAFEHGGSNPDGLAWYLAAESFRDDGWRDFSPSRASQLFGKLSQKSELVDLDLTLTRAVTKLTGNGLLPESMYRAERDSIFTHPDQTRNELTQLALSGRWWLGESDSLTTTLYHRRTRTRTLNGDVNDEFEGGPFDGISDEASGANNRTRTRQAGNGLAAQWNHAAGRQQIALGASFDSATMRFTQTSELGRLNASRGVSAEEAPETENDVVGRTRTASLYLTDTFALTPALALTAAARFNVSQVKMRDQLVATAPNLDGDHHFRKLNPALGLTWQAAPSLNLYAGASQGTRVPTPIELGCADPANPCTLPNAMAADPPLKQVVARTIEAGARGRLAGIDWNAGVFRTVNTDDILFVGTSTSAGYFTNFGRTRRQGIELGLAGAQGSVDWRVNYSYLHATFQSQACLLAENNSARGQSAACTAGGQDDEILVRKGNRIPGLPAHSLKLSLSWRAAPGLRLGADVQAFSGQYARGNENNRHRAGSASDAFGNVRSFDGGGRLPGYALLNLNGELDLGKGWQLFGRIDNVFDKRYATAAALAENPFDAAGAFRVDSGDWRHETFIAPGTPRVFWVGLRYAFGK
ncbi:MAG: TonB-dependent receptor [Rhodocyclales bacterium]|nr:TonB-dependent receptor [Rhodocyclales bacterium]